MKIKNAFIIVAITILLFSAIGIISNTTADTEPNDNYQLAEATTDFSNVIGQVSIGSSDVYDYYKLDLNGGSAGGDNVSIAIDFSIDIAPVNATVFLPVDNQWLLEVANITAVENGTYYINFTASENGEYYLEFEGYDSVYDAMASTIGPPIPNPGYNNNNTFANASFIPRGTTSGGGSMIDGQNCVDFYTFTTQKADVVDINFSFSKPWRFHLADSSFSENYQKVNYTPSYKRITFTEGAVGQTYYIVLNSPATVPSDEGAYTYTSSIAPSIFNRIPDLWLPKVTPASVPNNLDASLTFNVRAFDPDGDVTNVTVNCSSLWDGVKYMTNTTVDNWVKTLNLPKSNLTGGNHTITFKAFDDDGEWNTTETDLNVSFGNLAPQSSYSLANPLLFEAEEDLPNAFLDLDQFATDPDGDILDYRIVDGQNQVMTWLGDIVQVDLDNRAILEINCLENAFGKESITINCTDGVEELRFNITFSLLPINDPPTAPGIAYQIVDANPSTPLEKENLTVMFQITKPTDPDNETSFDYHFDYDGDSVFDETVGNRSEDEFNVLHTYNTSGDFSVTVAVEDAGGIQMTSNVNITVLEPYANPVWWEDGWQPAGKVIQPSIKINWKECEVHRMVETNYPENGTDTIYIDYLFSGTCSDGVELIQIYMGRQLEDEDYFYYPPENLGANGSLTSRLLSTEPDGTTWTISWTDTATAVTPAGSPEEGFLWFSAVAWKDGEFNVSEREGDHYVDGSKMKKKTDTDAVATEWWTTGFRPNEMVPNPTVEITFDECRVYTTEKRDTPAAGTITVETNYLFRGTVSADVFTVYIYLWDNTTGSGAYYPFFDPQNADEKLQVAPFGGMWSYEATITVTMDQQVYDDLKIAASLLSAEKPVIKYLGAAWNNNSHYNYAEKTALTEPAVEEKDDDEESIFDDSRFLIVVGVAAVVILIIIIVIIVVVAVKKSKKQKEIAEMERRLEERAQAERERNARDREDRNRQTDAQYMPPEPSKAASPPQQFEDYSAFQAEPVYQEEPPEEDYTDFEDTIMQETGGPKIEEDIGPLLPSAKDFEEDPTDDDWDDEEEEDEDDWDDEDDDDEDAGDEFLDIDEL